MVSDEFGHLPEYRGGYRNPPGSLWALLGLSGREEEAAKVGARPQAQSELGGVPAPLSFLSEGEREGE